MNIYRCHVIFSTDRKISRHNEATLLFYEYVNGNTGISFQIVSDFIAIKGVSKSFSIDTDEVMIMYYVWTKTKIERPQKSKTILTNQSGVIR